MTRTFAVTTTAIFAIGLLATAATSAGLRGLAALLAGSAACIALSKFVVRLGANDSRRLLSCSLLGGLASGLSLLAGAWTAGLSLFVLSSALLITSTQVALALRARRLRATEPELAAREAKASTLDPGLHLSLAADEFSQLRLSTAYARPRPAGALVEALRRLETTAWKSGEERLLHPLPAALEKPEIIQCNDVIQFRFFCAWQPHRSELAETLGRSQPYGRVTILKAGERVGPTLLVVPAPTFGSERAAGRLTRLRRWRSLGLDVALIRLPSGGSDDPLRGYQRDPLLASAWVERSVFELRRVAGWLRDSGAPAVGVLGFGWGASVASMLQTFDDRLAGAVLVAPVPRPQREAMLALRPELVAELATAHWSEDRVCELLEPWSPLGLPPTLPGEKVLLLAPTLDGRAPREDFQELRSHLRQPEWLPVRGARARAYALAGGAAERVESHLRRCLLGAGGRSEVPLSRFRR